MKRRPTSHEEELYLVIGFLIGLILGYLFFPTPARAFTINPTEGDIADGFLDPNRAALESLNGSAWYKVFDPNGLDTSCIEGSAIVGYLGPSSEWDFITDWTVVGTWTVVEYATDECSDAMETNTFTLTDTPPEPTAPTNPLINYLAPALDNATYEQLFLWTMLLIPTLLVLPLALYWLIFKPVALLLKLL